MLDHDDERLPRTKMMMLQHFGRRLAVTLILALSIVVGSAVASAGWLTDAASNVARDGPWRALGLAGPQPAPALDLALAQLQRLPIETATIALAAAVTAEGHWTFANREGQRFTAANTEEMKRVASTLAPDHRGPARFRVLLAAELALAHREAFTLLPADARLDLVAQGVQHVGGLGRIEHVQVARSVARDIQGELRAGRPAG